MRSLFISLTVFVALVFTVQADISLPKKQTFYDKMGRGLANVLYSPGEVCDSIYTTLQTDGPTVAFSKGLVQGTGRMFSDIGLGFADIASSPFPLPGYGYRTLKQAPNGGMIVNDYPPSDLLNNWY